MLSVFLYERQAAAQVVTQDSLALVALYNAQPALGDSTWFQGNVSTWTGVTIEGDRVTEFKVNNKNINDVIPPEVCGMDSLILLSLDQNQLTGSIPACIMDLPKLKYLTLSFNQLSGVEPGADFSHMTSILLISISNNRFSEMPDFLSISSPVFEALNVRFNQFNFDDLLPILSMPAVTNFTYDIQQDVGLYQRLDVSIGDTVYFSDVSALAGGTGNMYNWVVEEGLNTYNPPEARFKNVYSSSMYVEGAQLSDTRTYRCDITNPALPGLTLKTTQFDMFVTDPLLPQSISYFGDTVAYCNDSTLLLTATTTAGRPVYFVASDSAVATVNPDNTLALHQPGTAHLLATTPADSLYHADSLWIDITVASHLALPVFQIAQDLPTGEGKELKLSLPYIPGLTYQWTIPSGQLSDTSALVVSPFTASDLGLYNIRVTEGSCLHSSLFFNIDSMPYGQLIVYELITPNGDGDNETFYIENLNPAIGNEVSVFNAVHQIVFHQENYRNDWSGGDLPVGTYYYLIKYGEQTHKGNLYIKR